MPADADNLTFRTIQVSLVTPPGNLNQESLRNLFLDLGRMNFDSFSPSADGGASISNPRQQRVFTLGQVMRQIQIPVSPTLKHAIEDVLAVFRAAEGRLPPQSYLAIQFAINATVPVMGEQNRELLDRAVFRASPTFDELGPGRIGTGIKVFLAGATQSQVAIEPLLGTSDQLFVSYAGTRAGQVQLTDVEATLQLAQRYYGSQVKAFITQLLGDQ